MITTPAIAASFDNGMEFFSTFGGNTVSMAVGAAVLDIVQSLDLRQHADRVGRHLMGRLRPLPDRYPLVGDVRGAGLFVGIELVRDRGSLEPAADEATFVVNRMRADGVLIGTDGPFHNVLKIRPPMPFNARDADALADALERALDAGGRRLTCYVRRCNVPRASRAPCHVPTCLTCDVRRATCDVRRATAATCRRPASLNRHVRT